MHNPRHTFACTWACVTQRSKFSETLPWKPETPGWVGEEGKDWANLQTEKMSFFGCVSWMRLVSWGCVAGRTPQARMAVFTLSPGRF